MFFENSITLEDFLSNFWQKKACVFRQPIPHFTNPLSPDELAGLAMEEEIESRLVWQTPEKPPYWHLKRGPFKKKDFTSLPASHWTLLVQGVDRFVPEVADLLKHFTFIPQWRFDDVMISYAVNEGSVGPHYDNYDVFLYQAKGKRKWLLTSKNCHRDNYLDNVDLRIMNDFIVEEEHILEEGDMLYLPPHIAHHGISLTDECMTYSFGYRSLPSQELWENVTDYLAETETEEVLYQDPDFIAVSGSNEIPGQAWQRARDMLLRTINDDTKMQHWFAHLVTGLDNQAEIFLSSNEGEENQKDFKNAIMNSTHINHNPLCRFAYFTNEKRYLYINGKSWNIENVDDSIVTFIANNRQFELAQIDISCPKTQGFLYDLWRQHYIEFV